MILLSMTATATHKKMTSDHQCEEDKERDAATHAQSRQKKSDEKCQRTSDWHQVGAFHVLVLLFDFVVQKREEPCAQKRDEVPYYQSGNERCHRGNVFA
jgi:hypothetical protein